MAPLTFLLSPVHPFFWLLACVKACGFDAHSVALPPEVSK